jgi:hypothetical protein
VPREIITRRFSTQKTVLFVVSENALNQVRGE